MENFPMPRCIYHLPRALEEELYVTPRHTPRHKAVAEPRLNTIGVPLYSDRIWSYSWKENIASTWKINPTVQSQLYNLAKTKTGSKRLQGLLSRNSPRITWKILILVSDSIFELMADKYAHHLIKTLIDSCHQNQFQLQLQLVVSTITLDSTILTQALNNKYTVNSVKILVKSIKRLPDSISQLVSVLHHGFEYLMNNRVGCDVILKCLEVFNSEQNKLFYKAAIEHCLQLATHEKAYLSLIDFITYSRQPYRDNLLQVILENSVYLSQDPFGNFVIQHVIELQLPQTTEKLCSTLKNHFVDLSLQKAGSHVVEKCLNSSGMRFVVEEYLKSKKLAVVARDQFGNFVLTSALKVTKKHDSLLHYELLVKIESFIESLRAGYGKHVYNQIRNGVPVDKKHYQCRVANFV